MSGEGPNEELEFSLHGGLEDVEALMASRQVDHVLVHVG